jgi:hypothetical protein
MTAAGEPDLSRWEREELIRQAVGSSQVQVRTRKLLSRVITL